MTQPSDLEHLVALADMMGGHVRMSRRMRTWYAEAWTDGRVRLAVAEADTLTSAVLACLAKLRAKEGA